MKKPFVPKPPDVAAYLWHVVSGPGRVFSAVSRADPVSDSAITAASLIQAESPGSRGPDAAGSVYLSRLADAPSGAGTFIKPSPCHPLAGPGPMPA